MGIIEAIVKAQIEAGLQPVREHLQKQFQEMHEQTQRIALTQLVMEHEYEIQELKKEKDKLKLE